MRRLILPLAALALAGCASVPTSQPAPTPTQPAPTVATRAPEPAPRVATSRAPRETGRVTTPEPEPTAVPNLGSTEPATLRECIAAADGDRLAIWRCGAKFTDADEARDLLYRDGLRIVPPDCSALTDEDERTACKEHTYDNDDRREYASPSPSL